MTCLWYYLCVNSPRQIIFPVFIAGLILTLSGCGVGSFRKLHNDKMYEIFAEKHAQVYRAAYELCRFQHRMGYRVIRQPLLHSQDFRGVFQCEGPFDPTLAVRYEYLPTRFKFGNPPFSSTYYFTFTQRYESDKSHLVERRSTLNEENVDNLMRVRKKGYYH